MHQSKVTSLSCGQVLHLQAARGAVIVATGGTLLIDTAPLWLGESMVQERFSLREGEAHGVHRSGWILITAQAAAQVVCVPAPSKTSALLMLWQVVAVRLRRWRLRVPLLTQKSR